MRRYIVLTPGKCLFVVLGMLACVWVLQSYTRMSKSFLPERAKAKRPEGWIEDIHGHEKRTDKICYLSTDEDERFRRHQQYDLRIIVITYNRPSALLRLLNSLNKAEFNEDQIKLEIWIDRSKAGTFHNETIKTASEFQFMFGICEVIIHPVHVGIQGQWITTWKPLQNTSEIAVILEDDITLSPYFYRYLKLVHRKYDGCPEVNGYALQGISVNHKDGSRLVAVPESHPVYLYPVLGTWGFSPRAENWNRFTKWYGYVKKNATFNPYVPGSIVTDWYKSHQKRHIEDHMWSIWHVYNAWVNKEYTLYSNFGK